MNKGFMFAKCQVIRCIKDLRAYSKFSNQNDTLLCFLKKQAILELRFFFKHRHDLPNQKMRNYKYVNDLCN